MMKEEIATFYPTSKAQWRAWLQENHRSKTAIWLVHYKKSSGIPTISWSDAVDEALCFGWIDSIRKTLDDDRFIQFFSKRKPKGTWSKVNKDKIKLLIDAGLMTTAGFEAITTAKENGSWIILDAIQKLNIPKDLSSAFKSHNGSKKYFMSLSKSVRKAILQWIILAKRPETRLNRINEIAELAGQKLKPKQFR